MKISYGRPTTDRVSNTYTCFTFTSSGIPDESQKELRVSGCYICVAGQTQSTTGAEDYRSCLAQFRLRRRANFSFDN